MNATRRGAAPRLARVTATLVVALAPVLALAAPEGGHEPAEGGHAVHHGIKWWGFPSEEDGRVGFLILLINFVVLLLVLNKLLFRGLVARNREKSDAIRDELDRATAARHEAEALVAQYDAKVTALESEVAAIRAEARAASERERESLLAEAREQAAKLLEAAQTQAEREAIRRRSELEGEIVDQALARAEETIRRSFGDADQRRLLDSYVAEVTAIRLDQAGGF